jgi:hypothetical protein
VVVALVLEALTAELTALPERSMSLPGLMWWSALEVWWILLLAAVVLGGATLVLTLLSRHIEPPIAAEEEKPESSIIALINWVKDDREVRTPQQDRFGHDKVAMRIARRIADADDEAPTMAVVGRLGSGKSTIRELVAHHLKDSESQTEITHLSLWVYETPQAAVIGILGALVDAMSRHVNTVGLTGLSARYVESIEAVAGRWAFASRYLRGEQSPASILRALERIASATGIRFVLWIEDLERFSGVDRLSGEQAARREAEQLGPILSLLHQLDRCTGISVIVADTTLRSRFDVEKIARFIEEPPRPDPAFVWWQIGLLRNHCLSYDVIDPASAEYRDELATPGSIEGMSRAMWQLRYEEPRIQQAIALLLETPRALKSALRITWETWQKLHGEIDFDSVLVASVLRVSRPTLFAHIDENIEVYRQGFSDPLSGSNASRVEHPVYVQLQALLAHEDQDVRRTNAAKAVVSYLFRESLPFGPAHAYAAPSPQALCYDQHTDYWRRYAVLPEIPTSERDQSALRSIEDWKRDKPRGLIDRLVVDATAPQIESFVGQFSGSELCDVLRDVALALIDVDDADWRLEHRAPGLGSLLRMMIDRRPPPRRLVSTLKSLIQKVTHTNVPLAHELSYLFANSDHRSTDLLDPESRVSIRGDLVDAFTRAFPPRI